MSLIQPQKPLILLIFKFIGDLTEKVVAAITLKDISSDEILERCIEKAIDTRSDFENELTNQDVFFREITRISRGLQQINAYSEEVANSALNLTEIAETIRKCNELLLVK